MDDLSNYQEIQVGNKSRSKAETIKNIISPSNLRPTTRECVHLVTRGRFRSRDTDGGRTIRSAVAENPLTARKLHGSYVWRKQSFYCSSNRE